MKVSKVVFYDEPSVPEINLDGLVEFARKNLRTDVEKRGPILAYGRPDTPSIVAATRIFKLSVPFVRHEPTPEEIRFEEKNIRDTANNPNITYYDGIELQNALGQLIPQGELTRDILHVIFTNKLGCTYDYSDYRYHGRAVICSNPAVISTTGMIEAPAKPREYYAELITNSRLGVNVEALREKYAGTFLEYHDKRLGAVAEGYFLQALLYYVSGEPFCDDRDCRLFNAHWQADLLHAQLGVRRLCKRHQKILDSVKGRHEAGGQ